MTGSIIVGSNGADEWLQITGADATVTEEFWAYAATPANTDVVMGAMWAPESNPCLECSA